MKGGRIRSIGVFVAVVLAAAGCASKSGGGGGGGGTSKQLKVALLEPSVRNDLSWNQVAYEGLQTVAGAEGMQFAYTDNIGYAAQDAARFARLYAQRGFNLIVAHNSSYKDGIMQVAQKFPDVNFVYQDDGAVATAMNVSGYNMDIYQAAYLGGILAGGTSKTGMIGAVGGLPIPFCFAYFHAFLNGAKTVNPNAQIKALYIGNFGDIEHSKSAAETLADRGADEFVACGDGAARGLVEAATQRKLMTFGYMHDMSVLAPFNVIASIDWNAEKSYQVVLRDLKTGKFRPTKHYDFNLKNGMVQLDINPSLQSQIPRDVLAKVKQAEADAAAGKLEIPFEGSQI